MLFSTLRRDQKLEMDPADLRALILADWWMVSYWRTKVRVDSNIKYFSILALALPPADWQCSVLHLQRECHYLHGKWVCLPFQMQFGQVNFYSIYTKYYRVALICQSFRQCFALLTWAYCKRTNWKGNEQMKRVFIEARGKGKEFCSFPLVDLRLFYKNKANNVDGKWLTKDVEYQLCVDLSSVPNHVRVFLLLMTVDSVEKGMYWSLHCGRIS